MRLMFKGYCFGSNHRASPCHPSGCLFLLLSFYLHHNLVIQGG